MARASTDDRCRRARPRARRAPSFPPKTDDGTGTDAGKDVGQEGRGPKAEAGVDAGPPPPVEGTTCPTLNAIAQKNCGACGKAETVCLDDGDRQGRVEPLRSLQQRARGRLYPRHHRDRGLRQLRQGHEDLHAVLRVSSGACTGQPANSCVPGSVDYTSAGCAASTYRNRTCGATCTYGSYSRDLHRADQREQDDASPAPSAASSRRSGRSRPRRSARRSAARAARATVSSDGDVPLRRGRGDEPDREGREDPGLPVGSPTGSDPRHAHLGLQAGTSRRQRRDARRVQLRASDSASCSVQDLATTRAATPGGNSLDWAGVDNVVDPGWWQDPRLQLDLTTATAVELGTFNLNIKTTKSLQ